MFERHKTTSFLIGLFYVLVISQSAGPQNVIRILVLAFLLFCALALYYNKRYLEHLQKYNFWVLLRLALLYLSGFALFVLLPTPTLRWLFLLTAFFVVSLAELNLGNFSENLLINETLAAAFGLLMGLAAAAQYFPDIRQIALRLGGWHILNWQFSLEPFYLIGVFATVMLLSRSFYDFIPQAPKTKWVAAVALGLFCGELFWAEIFLPFHYSAQASILFCLFYFCLVLNYYYLFHTLSLKKIQFHLFLIAMAIGLVVVATPWKTLA